jgi:hypothetical protein
MLKQGHSEEKNINGEEARENRLRNPSPPFAIAEVPLVEKTPLASVTKITKITERVSPKTQGNTGNISAVREKQQVKPKRVSSGTQSLWRELVTENPMYHKELLAGRRNVELRTPWRRFWAKAIPIGILGSIYASIYYAISWVYIDSYTRFDASTMKESTKSPVQYALEQSMIVSAIAYTVIMGLLFLVIGLGIPLIATLRITNEREKMNWNALIMSRLTPAQILIGKAAPVLRLIGMIYLAALPALIITALLVIFPAFTALDQMKKSPDLSSANMPQISDIVWWFLRVAILPPLVIGATAILNTMIATYYSLVKKRGGEASVGTMRGTFLLIFGPIGLTGLLYAVPNIISLIQNKMQESTVNFLPWVHPLLFSPNIFSPIGALIASFWPQIMLRNYETGQYAFSDKIWFYLVAIAPFVYIVTALGLTRAIWKRMLKVFENTPKDASG